MKILIVTNMYPTKEFPSYGIFLKELAEGLRRFGVYVDIFFSDTKRTRAAYLIEIPNLANQIRTGKYDLIHAHHTYCVYQILFVRLLVSNLPPVLFTIHEGEAFLGEGVCDPHADFLKRLVYSKRMKRWAMVIADFVISVERRLPQAVGYRGPFEVISLGVNAELFHPMDKLKCREVLALPKNEQIVFYPANPKRDFNKGYKLFQEALTTIKPAVRVITGGYIPHNQMPIYMNAADVIVQTSLFEASPMVVKEAMACNCSMVSTDVGDVREIFGETPGYFLCGHDSNDIGKKIEQALQFSQTIRGRERILALGLRLEQSACKNITLYERIINGR